VHHWGSPDLLTNIRLGWTIDIDATTLSITTFSKMILSIMDFISTFGINDIQLNNTQHSHFVLLY